MFSCLQPPPIKQQMSFTTQPELELRQIDRKQLRLGK